MRTGSSRRTRLVMAMSAFVLPLGACSPASQLNAVLNQQVGEVLGQIQDVVIVRVINQTNNDIQLDVLVDGLTQTISCSSVIQVCDAFLSGCPQVIQASAQRSLDPQGRFVGGRVFNGNEAFTFRQGDELNCQSTVVYKFTEVGADAFAI